MSMPVFLAASIVVSVAKNLLISPLTSIDLVVNEIKPIIRKVIE